MSDYGWIVDFDWLDDVREDIKGPSSIPEDLILRLDNGEGRKFRIYDDDGELYYSGRIVFSDPTLGAENTLHLPEEAFGPLWDYGAPNAGATEIRYKVDGKWIML